MDEPKPKRRLPIVSAGEPDASDEKRLMTEVLPDPTRRDGPGTARQRTLERMARLMAIAVASSALGARCGPHAGVPPPDVVADPPGYGVVDMLPSPPPRADAQVATPPAPPPDPPGYGVVDMLPSPPPTRTHPPHRRPPRR